MEDRKNRKSKNWLGNYKLCIFVPPTPSSELQKLMQVMEKELRPGGRENFPKKIIETAGKPLERVLVINDPFDGNKCSDKQCLPNRNPKNHISCRRNNVGYGLTCKICHWDGGSGPEPELNPATYLGETGENLHTRMKNHESRFQCVTNTILMSEYESEYIRVDFLWRIQIQIYSDQIFLDKYEYEYIRVNKNGRI